MSDYIAVYCFRKGCDNPGRIPTDCTWNEARQALLDAGWHCNSGTWRCGDCWNAWQASLTGKIKAQTKRVKKERSTP